jgi:hypothetical protein
LVTIEKLRKNPFNHIVKEVSKAIMKSSLDEETKESDKKTSMMIRRIYGLPKIHKEETPSRPTVYTIR